MFWNRKKRAREEAERARYIAAKRAENAETEKEWATKPQYVVALRGDAMWHVCRKVRGWREGPFYSEPEPTVYFAYESCAAFRNLHDAWARLEEIEDMRRSR